MNTLTTEEMLEYGYTYTGMTPIDIDTARKLYDSIAIFRLYIDDTEALVDNMEDIETHAYHGGIFGLEINQK